MLRVASIAALAISLFSAPAVAGGKAAVLNGIAEGMNQFAIAELQAQCRAAIASGHPAPGRPCYQLQAMGLGPYSAPAAAYVPPPSHQLHCTTWNFGGSYTDTTCRD